MDPNMIDPDQISAEELRAILATGGDEYEQRSLDEQAAQAQALMQPGEQHYTTMAGGILGGIGNAMRAYNGALDMNAVKDARKKMSEERKTGRNTTAQVLLRRQRAMQQPGTAMAMTPTAGPQALASSPFSYGGGAQRGFGLGQLQGPADIGAPPRDRYLGGGGGY